MVDPASRAFSRSSLTIENGDVITWPLHTDFIVSLSSFCIVSDVQGGQKKTFKLANAATPIKWDKAALFKPLNDKKTKNKTRERRRKFRPGHLSYFKVRRQMLF